ncbi:MAG TPA: hypothetical protein VFU05_17675 [Cyclobacteriaceae bacterium]|nr:hypothetical protein [Cyclobacteriaceae bacterium]
MTDSIELKKWAPFATIGIVILSFLNLHFFYSGFGIQIYNYLDVSEIIFSLTAFFASLFSLLYFVVFLYLFIRQKSKNESEQDTVETENKALLYFRNHKLRYLRFLHKLFDGLTPYILLTTILVALFSLYLAGSFPQSELLKSSMEYEFHSFLFIILLSGYITLLSIWIGKRTSVDKKDGYLFISALLINTLLFLMIRNSKSSELIMAGHPKYSVEMTTNHKRYSTNDSLVFIGNTKNYYFLYNRKSKESFIIPSNSILETKMHRLRFGL